MNRLLKVLIIILIYSGLYAQPWKFNISLEKTKYFEGEPIFLLVELENISNSNYEVTYLSSGGAFKITLRNEQGDIIPDPNENSNRQFIQKVDMTFKHNEMLVAIRDIGSELGKGFFKRDMMPHLKKGKYSVQIRFEDLLIKNEMNTLRKKYYFTQILNFEVVSPDPSSRIMLDKFINIYENRFNIGWEKVYHDYIELINTDITNPYVTTVAYYLKGGNAEVYHEKEIMDLIMKYPNRYWAVSLADGFLNDKLYEIKINAKLKNTVLDKLIKSRKFFWREYKKYEGIYFQSKEKFLEIKRSKARGDK